MFPGGTFTFSGTRDTQSTTFGTQSGTQYATVSGVKCTDNVSPSNVNSDGVNFSRF